MVKQIGTVISVVRNRVRVEFAPGKPTPSPDAPASPCCTPAAVPGPDEQVEAVSGIAVHCGDRVEVLVPARRGLAARLAPLWPAVVLPVVGAVAGGMARGDAGAGIGIAAGLVLGIATALLVGRRMSGGSRDKARVLRIVGLASPAGHSPACAAHSERM
jgi:positive regulator of sigma E activity